MEKRAGWGAEYPDNVRNGEWEYQAFKADKSVNTGANLGACFNCHKPLDKQDYVYLYDKMKAAAKELAAGEFCCGREGCHSRRRRGRRFQRPKKMDARVKPAHDESRTTRPGAGAFTHGGRTEQKPRRGFHSAAKSSHSHAAIGQVEFCPQGR